jgi:hypothetical protein
LAEPGGTGEDVGLTPEQIAEQLRRMKVSDLLLSTLFTLSQLAYGKLEPSGRDLDGARLAIDSMRALLPVLEGAIPPDATRDFQQVLTNLQLAYASAAAGGQTPGQGGEGAEPEADGGPGEPDAPPADEPRGQTPGHGRQSEDAAREAAAGGEASDAGESAADEPRGQTPGHGREGDADD